MMDRKQHDAIRDFKNWVGPLGASQAHHGGQFEADRPPLVPSARVPAEEVVGEFLLLRPEYKDCRTALLNRARRLCLGMIFVLGEKEWQSVTSNRNRKGD